MSLKQWDVSSDCAAKAHTEVHTEEALIKILLKVLRRLGLALDVKYVSLLLQTYTKIK